MDTPVRMTFALDITWDVEALPRHVGPFDTRAEAVAWAKRNTSTGGSWEVHPLAPPYLASVGDKLGSNRRVVWLRWNEKPTQTFRRYFPVWVGRIRPAGVYARVGPHNAGFVLVPKRGEF